MDDIFTPAGSSRIPVRKKSKKINVRMRASNNNKRKRLMSEKIIFKAQGI